MYRTLSIPGNRTLADLHLCIQNAFGWQDYHLHEFVLNGTSFGEPTDDDWHPVVWDDIVSLDELRLKTGDKFLYRYDFGDDWQHSIKVRSKAKLSGEVAWEAKCACTAGARAAPPEDCGGINGYESLIECLSTPASQRSEDQHELIEWAGRWKPEKFNLNMVNKKLAKR